MYGTLRKKTLIMFSKLLKMGAFASLVLSCAVSNAETIEETLYLEGDLVAKGKSNSIYNGLIVNTSNLVYNSIRLTAEGYEIVSAGDGEEALALAVKERPDLILSDVMMPKISGFDMLDILRQTPETKAIKVIMMTALSSEDQRKRGEGLGADKYLVKSQVGIEDVIAAVHEVLDGKTAGASASPMQEVAGVSDANAVAQQAPVQAPIEAPQVSQPMPAPQVDTPQVVDQSGMQPMTQPIPEQPVVQTVPQQPVVQPAPQQPISQPPLEQPVVQEPIQNPTMAPNYNNQAEQGIQPNAPVQPPAAPAQ